MIAPGLCCRFRRSVIFPLEDPSVSLVLRQQLRQALRAEEPLQSTVAATMRDRHYPIVDFGAYPHVAESLGQRSCPQHFGSRR
jgi:hypothetical protein